MTHAQTTSLASSNINTFLQHHADSLLHQQAYTRVADWEQKMQDADRAFALFLINVGSIATVAETFIVDTHEALKNMPSLYRHSVKKAINTARADCRKLIRMFYTQCDQTSRGQMWLDCTDCIDDALQTDLTKLRYAVLNAYRRVECPYPELFATTLIAYNLSHMMNTFRLNYDTLAKQMNMIYKPVVGGMFGTLTEAIKKNVCIAAEGVGLDNIVFTKEELLTIQTGFRVIENKMSDFDWMDHQMHVALSLSGVDETNMDGDTSNNYTPWNDVQIGILMNYWNKAGHKETAAMLHRSVGACKMMMWRMKRSCSKLKKGGAE